MAKDATEVRIGSNGSILVAPVGTAEPTNIHAAWPAGWVDLGYATEDGVTIIDGKTSDDKRAWQSFYPIRRVVTEKIGTGAFTLEQWGPDQVRLAFGGGTITSDGAGMYRYTPPAPDIVDERAVAFEWIDGAVHYRWIFRRTTVSDNVETKIVRGDLAVLPITVGILGTSGLDPFVIMTDEASWAAAAS